MQQLSDRQTGPDARSQQPERKTGPAARSYPLSIENVTKSYSTEVVAVKDASFDVAKGEFVFLVGPSGSGKSTVAKLINLPADHVIGPMIAIGKGTLVEGGATIKAPAIIGDHTEVRQGAYLRGYCLIGNRCVVGHTTEVKHSVFLDDAKAGHFAYLGDSIIGNHANLGAGTKCANLRFIPGNVQVSYEGELYSTGRRKFGAIIGDEAQTGCNSVTSPGTILARSCFLMPNTTAPSGFLSERRIG